jgi:hypothetical protein
VGTAAAGAIGTLALLLALFAIVLATVANRRWARRARRPPFAQTTADSSVMAAVSANRGILAEHETALAAQQSQLTAQDRQLSSAEATLAAHVEALADLRDQVAGLATQVAAMSDATRDLRAGDEAVHVALRTSLRHVAIVRYDAFADVGGRLSYSTAILDDTETGLVITALAGKSDIRTYIKAVSGGVGQPALTPEEEQAVRAATGTTQ